jgi:uncharacterized membrane protein
MSAPRTPGARGDRDGAASRYSWKAILALVLAVVALFVVDILPMLLAAIGVVFALLARRELEREPDRIGGRLWIPAVIVAGFVIVTQAIFVAAPLFMSIF